MIPAWTLEAGEGRVWQGRPAPRCYTFRRWQQTLIGSILFVASCLWLLVGWQLAAEGTVASVFLLLPAALSLFALLLGPLQLIRDRLRWERIFYAVTDRRRLLLLPGGDGTPASYALDQLVRVQQKKYGKLQRSFRLHFSDGATAVVECLEHAENFSCLLPLAAQEQVQR